VLDGVAWATEAGYSRQLLLSLDICAPEGLTAFAGGGHAALHDFIIPKLLARGVSPAEIRKITEQNPQRVLAILPRS
jgi:predicted metal-dependent phosphotriesterase family hydrolase